jgi:hypothetical protein
VEQVDALAKAVGLRWRLTVYLGAYGPMRPEEQAELRRKDVDLDLDLDLDAMTIRVIRVERRALPSAAPPSGGSGAGYARRRGCRRTFASTTFATQATRWLPAPAPP